MCTDVLLFYCSWLCNVVINGIETDYLWSEDIAQALLPLTSEQEVFTEVQVALSCNLVFVMPTSEMDILRKCRLYLFISPMCDESNRNRVGLLKWVWISTNPSKNIHRNSDNSVSDDAQLPIFRHNFRYFGTKIRKCQWAGFGSYSKGTKTRRYQLDRAMPRRTESHDRHVTWPHSAICHSSDRQFRRSNAE
jgi:hypothetical protein